MPSRSAETEFAISYAWLANYLATNHREEEAKAVVRKAADHLDHAAKRGLAPAFHINALFTSRSRGCDWETKRAIGKPVRRCSACQTTTPTIAFHTRRLWILLSRSPCGRRSQRAAQAGRRICREQIVNYQFEHPSVDLRVLGGLLYRAGQYEQAAQRLEESIAAYPQRPAAWPFARSLIRNCCWR